MLKLSLACSQFSFSTKFIVHNVYQIFGRLSSPTIVLNFCQFFGGVASPTGYALSGLPCKQNCHQMATIARLQIASRRRQLASYTPGGVLHTPPTGGAKFATI